VLLVILERYLLEIVSDGFLPLVTLATFELTGTNSNLPTPANTVPVVKQIFGHFVLEQITGDVTFFIKMISESISRGECS